MNDAWLQSDGTIIGRAQKSPHNEGVMWAVDMPDGVAFGVVLAKEDAGSVSQFCEMVRAEWDERKEEQAAKARRDMASKYESDAKEPSIAGVEAALSHNEPFAKRIHRELREATERLNEATKITRELVHEVKALTAAKEALDAQEDGTEESGNTKRPDARS